MTHQPRASFQSPRFAQPATFLRLPHVEDPRGLDVAIVGIPYDGGTSYRPGARLGPREIRAQSSLIRSYSYFQKVAPFDVLNVADAGDVDASPVGIEKAYDGDRSAHRRDCRRRRAADCDRRRPFDLAADPPRARRSSRAAGADPVRRAHRHLGRILRRKVLSRHPVPASDRRGRGRPDAVRAGRHPRPDVRRRGFRVSPRSRHHDDRHRSSEGPRRRLDHRRDRARADRACLHDVRHRRRRSRVRAGHRNPGSRRPHQPRGPATGARAGRPATGRRRHRRGVAGVRRPRADHGAACRESIFEFLCVLARPQR